MSEEPIAAGKSSFSLVDVKKLFKALPLSGKCGFLDLGCGNGAYSLALSSRIDENAVIYAVDLWEEGIKQLRAAILEKDISNVRALLSDVERTLLPDESVDLCLMATMLHDLIVIGKAEGALKELVRVMKPGGDLAVIEFKKIEPPPGPPIDIRISPGQITQTVASSGFELIRSIELGPYLYLCLFKFKH